MELKWFISPFVAVFPQWQPFVQNIQAQEEYPGGFSSVWAVETRRGDAGEWKPAHGGHVARGGRLKWVGRRQQWVLPFFFSFPSQLLYLSSSFSFFSSLKITSRSSNVGLSWSWIRWGWTFTVWALGSPSEDPLAFMPGRPLRMLNRFYWAVR